MNVLSLFDGISCGQTALNNVGIEVDNYYASEITTPTITITQKNYPDTVQLGDINGWKDWDLPKIDLITGGSPCQGFSNQGKGLNFEDPRSMLFFKFVEVLEHYKPKYFLLENVRMKLKWQQIITDILGVPPMALNSNMFVPQNRIRLYWTNIPSYHYPVDTDTSLLDILEEDVPEIYYLTETQLSKLDLNYKWSVNRIVTHRAGVHQQDVIYRHDGIMGCLSAATHGAARHLTKTYLADGRVRRLTEIECERLQGLPDDYTKGISSGNRYEAIGNGWTIPVIAYFLKEIKNNT